MMRVVSYWNSTSNHNISSIGYRKTFVVSYWNSTSNHNARGFDRTSTPLYLIEILHQTTTLDRKIVEAESCILLKFYIKPQHQLDRIPKDICCILLKFYIKPQRQRVRPDVDAVVSYWNSTSNHNCVPSGRKPPKVVSYWNSTSNHNWLQATARYCQLYLIEILHQTTTTRLHGQLRGWLYLIEILHQTTTRRFSYNSI